jgi:hypothetical protein
MRNVEGSLGKKEEDYFATFKKFMRSPEELLNQLKGYDREHMN